MSNEMKSQVLLIDDDMSLLAMLSDFLKFEGYDVTTADSGEEGLERLETTVPDLIILDMSMPGMGGIGFLKAISDASGRPRFPVLVLTARANMAEFFADVEVDGFIAKPCDTDDLLMEVGRIIFLRRGQREAELAGKLPRKKVLIAEDSEAIEDRLLSSFSERGYVVDTAGSGPEALEKAIVGRPGVIVMKLVLKGMNGDAVASMLKEMPNTCGIPVILYDDSSSARPEVDYVRPGGNVKALVRGNLSADILAACKRVLA